MEETNGASCPSWIDRIERVIERLTHTEVEIREDIKVLLRGQAAFLASLEKLIIRVDGLKRPDPPPRQG